MAQSAEAAAHIFEQFDTDHNGVLDKGEFQRLIAAVSVKLGAADPPSEAQVTTILTTFDTNHDGKISREEFAVMVAQLFPGMAA